MVSSLRSALVGLFLAGCFGCGNAAKSLAADPPVTNKPATKQASATKQDVASENPTGNLKYRLAYKFQPNQTVWYDVRHEMRITTQYGEATDVAHNKSESQELSRGGHRRRQVRRSGTDDRLGPHDLFRPGKRAARRIPERRQ